MSADIRALNLRLPADLHRRLGEAAAGSGRSLNAEIVHRLAESFEYVDVDNAVLEEMSARMTTIEQAYRDMTEELARSGEHTSALQSLMRISSAVFCMKKKTQ